MRGSAAEGLNVFFKSLFCLLLVFLGHKLRSERPKEVYGDF